MPFFQSWGTKLHQIWGGHKPTIDTAGFVSHFRNVDPFRNAGDAKGTGSKTVEAIRIFFSFPCRN